VARSAIKQRDLDIDTPEPARAEQPSESAPDDQHPCSTVTHHFIFSHSRTYSSRFTRLGLRSEASLLDETVSGVRRL